MAEAMRPLGVSEVPFYCWSKEDGGMSGDQRRHLRALEQETARLRRAVSDLTRDTQILAETARGHSATSERSISLSLGTRNPPDAWRAGSW